MLATVNCISIHYCKFLHEEAKLVLLYACLVSEGKLICLQRTSQLRMHKKIFTVWHESEEG